MRSQSDVFQLTVTEVYMSALVRVKNVALTLLNLSLCSKLLTALELDVRPCRLTDGESEPLTVRFNRFKKVFTERSTLLQHILLL